MPEKKDMAGEDKEPQVRGRKGPDTSAPNEEARARDDKDASRGVPKIGKHEAGGKEGELH